MRTHTANRNTPSRSEAAFVGVEPKIFQPRSTPPGRRGHRSFVPSTETLPRPQSEPTELLADIDGVPVLVRLLVADMPLGAQAHFGSGDTDLHSLLSATVEKVIERIDGSSPRSDDSSKQVLATIEIIPSKELLARLPVPSNDTVLRVGPLELDLLDRTAKRADRQIDLRPREFRLLKYMMQRSDQLLTREILLKEVWNYKFVPETNLVDVHMGRLRHKIDGLNEPPLIRSVRGSGFVLGGTPFFTKLDDAICHARRNPPAG
jgi:DNA-binding winged helix-turn-helix (wHTH) protein